MSISTAQQAREYADNMRCYTLKVRTVNNTSVEHVVDSHEASVQYTGSTLNVLFYNREVRTCGAGNEQEMYDRIVASYGFTDVSNYLLSSKLPSLKAEPCTAEAEPKKEELGAQSVTKGVTTINWSGDTSFDFYTADATVRSPSVEEISDFPAMTPQEIAEFNTFLDVYEENCKAAEIRGGMPDNRGARPLTEVIIERSAKSFLKDYAAERTVKDIEKVRDVMVANIGTDPEPALTETKQTEIDALAEMIQEHLAKDPIPAISGLHLFEVSIVDTNSLSKSALVSGYATKFEYYPRACVLTIGEREVNVPVGAVVTIKATKA